MNKAEDYILSKLGQQCLQALLRIWFDFERRLSKVPIVQRLEQGRMSQDDYQKLLLNLRQQVIEGSRWISRCASSFDRNYADVRSTVIKHAKDEHRDYEMLEQDYVASGGELNTIQRTSRNPGSEALHGFMMYRAGLQNPIDLVGAMWIIEGLGNKMALDWAERVDKTIKIDEPITRFMRYHADNDEGHLQVLYKLIDRVCIDNESIKSISRTATVVARLYVMQLEEVDHA